MARGPIGKMVMKIMLPETIKSRLSLEGGLIKTKSNAVTAMAGGISYMSAPASKIQGL